MTAGGLVDDTLTESFNAGDIHDIDVPLGDLLADRDAISEIRSRVQTGDLYLVRNLAERDRLERFRSYLISIAQHSLPNYVPIEQGAPNSHRMNNDDARAFVQGAFHQFTFFPWNQDLFEVFHWFRDIYRLKNLVSGIDADRFLDREPMDGCIARISVQFYPRGGGHLNCHADPVDHHQLSVPTLQLCRKGEDYQSGGAYVVQPSGDRVSLDDRLEWGDLALFNARTAHGVEPVDPDVERDWPSFEGRWIVLFAVNKLHSNDGIANSVDLGSTAESEAPGGS